MHFSHDCGSRGQTNSLYISPLLVRQPSPHVLNYTQALHAVLSRLEVPTVGTLMKKSLLLEIPLSLIEIVTVEER